MNECSECGDLLADLSAQPGSVPPALRDRMEAEQCRRCIEAYQKTVSLCRRALAPAESGAQDVDVLLRSLRDRLGIV